MHSGLQFEIRALGSSEVMLAQEARIQGSIFVGSLQVLSFPVRSFPVRRVGEGYCGRQGGPFQYSLGYERRDRRFANGGQHVILSGRHVAANPISLYHGRISE